MNQLFTQRSLKKRHRVGDRNGPITLLSPPLRATLGLGALIAIAGGLWATLARIPVSVEGTGVLLPVSTINSSISGTDGTAIYMFNKTREAWHIQAREFIVSPDQFSDREVAELAKLIYRMSQMQQNPGGSSQTSAEIYAQKLDETFRGLEVAKGTLLIWVKSPAELESLSSSIDELERTIRETSEKSENINATQQIHKSELVSRLSYLVNMRKLEAKGFVSKQSVLQEQAQVDNIRSQIYSNNNQLIEISSTLNSSYQKLRTETAKLINNQLIFASRNVYLSNLYPNNGESIKSGDVVMQLSNEPLEQPVMVPVFLSSNEMAQVFPGMKALATPSGYKRSEVGGIRGTVISMGKLPSGLSEVEARVGVSSMAQTIIDKEPSPTLAVLALERSGSSRSLNSGGYRWSSRSNLPFPPTPGDRLSVEITTRRVAPISLVLPTIRSFFGLTPPPQPTQNQNKQK